ncbi:hypothetical protein M011DRAFT_257041 [Sporormia fimetaria CBS 119925]|uniref:Uncharacterized protein n=1 Tax=Sporormia fimetaria CBS 119925 TaxID=1340428 RepID=A0A6A6UZ34_9PLEO|nr:hypothetical protein M011DRAFT_257041 [Sporormia fimetaria CBS 119925]
MLLIQQHDVTEVEQTPRKIWNRSVHTRSYSRAGGCPRSASDDAVGTITAPNLPSTKTPAIYLLCLTLPFRYPFHFNFYFLEKQRSLRSTRYCHRCLPRIARTGIFTQGCLVSRHWRMHAQYYGQLCMNDDHVHSCGPELTLMSDNQHFRIYTGLSIVGYSSL